jgi:catechol 2,3-dioxygenase-like lactoylglutathione lyase family enzyme
MKQSIAHVALVVRDYDEAIDFTRETTLYPGRRHVPTRAG